MRDADPGAGDGVSRTDVAVEAEPAEPVMPPAPPFPIFDNTPTLPQQVPGNGFESGRDSRAR
ncbi:hypothetical protein Acsp01_16030 [Actinoplanes sp. NBRC 101535]|nr:hypothetical protein Acsp01_16030 [Actinoplanes sp. NBRC 101535]